MLAKSAMARILPLLLFATFVDAQLLLNSTTKSSEGWTTSPYSLQSELIPKEECPPCFNCLLPAFKCGNYGECNQYDGQCRCPEGWSGNECLTPQCGSLAAGDKRRPRAPGKECECDEGWGGINCNVCQTDQACHGFPLPELERLRLARIAEGKEADEDEPIANMTCFKEGYNVRNMHDMCDVTNRKILDMLPDRPPQVTFECNASDHTCAFQFWIGKVESFYCGLEQCEHSVKFEYDRNVTSAHCEKIKCSCVPGRMLCGENGSVDISDFLEEDIKGPASFQCKGRNGCTFQEPAMNDLIDEMFGDPYITLKCSSGECLHYTQVPGYQPPPKPDYTQWVALSAAAAASVFLLAVAGFWYAGRQSESGSVGGIKLPEDEAARLIAEHVPASLYFSNISYTIPSGQKVLQGVSGTVKSGEILAIMGPSGAGKSTLLDILARRQKRGTVEGISLVNGRPVTTQEFKKVVGFVDQEDTLMSTLTVYETVLYSALLRLPREMSFEAKKFRTLETLHELGILGIKNSRIGDSGNRSISGGEKRRVSIACELVTSPSILFLDEPTSGLDAYNAYNVVESLVTLTKQYNRTVVFTIHQPRSNIVALFDQLVVLAKGESVYSGPMRDCQSYFEGIGWKCPPGFNIADYLIDLTMQAAGEVPREAEDEQGNQVLNAIASHSRADEEHGVTRNGASGTSSQTRTEEAVPRKSMFSQLKQTFGVANKDVPKVDNNAPLKKEVHLESLVKAYRESDIAKYVKEEIDAAGSSAHPPLNGNTTPHTNGAATPASGSHRDVVEETGVIRGRRRASWTTQFRILSGRAFKNLYRNPALLTAHYAAAVAIAVICGLLVYHVTNDISGFQNRLGFFFFTLALFGFSCLSSLSLFANERILFMRERANGYYSSFTYFSSKVLFDIVPLRVVPALVYGSIVYGLVGLVPTLPGFWKFLLILVLFNLTTASVILFVSIAIANTGVAGLVGTLIMLYNLLFAGLLINRDSVSPWVDWLHTVSFFHAAYEALAVNELRYLSLKETKYGVELDVPAAAILSTFGFRAQSFWWPDTIVLAVIFTAFLTASALWLHYFVKEKR